MKYIASVSWGKDSLAMLLMLIEKGCPLDEAVFYDTGMEFKAIYDTRDKVLPLLAEKGIEYTELHPDYSFEQKMFEIPVIRNSERKCDNCKHYKQLSLSWGCCDNQKSKFYEMHDEYMGGLPSEKSIYGKGSCKLLELTQYTKYGYSWCGGRCRWGTTDKLKALDKYAESQNAQVYIGIAADEEKRIAKERKPYKLFPLVEWGMVESKCLTYCYDHGFHWIEDAGAGDVSLYYVLDRVSCWCCANKNLKELRNIRKHLPEYWERLKDLQRRTARPMKGEGKSVFELEERFEREEATHE